MKILHNYGLKIPIYVVTHLTGYSGIRAYTLHTQKREGSVCYIQWELFRKKAEDGRDILPGSYHSHPLVPEFRLIPKPP